MDLKRASSFDLEAQTSSNGGGGGSRASSFRMDLHKPTSNHDSTESGGDPLRSLPQNSNVTHEKNGEKDAAGVPGNTIQPESRWKPWKPDEPYHTKVPKTKTTMEDWVKAMGMSDDGMCKGWREQIDTLVIFAGLFSATVTAFTVESYQWLDETPADMLARLQLRNLLNATQDPAIDYLAPATFHASTSSVLINALWFASLTIALAAVVISILCRQWLYEYQRYDNFTTDEAFLIRGLRYRGLKAWRVPEIIASLPILLQTALVLFLVGVLVLLWPLQMVVASIISAIVGLTFIFLGITTILPAIQYVHPAFDTQCAYKSSQSWTFFLFSAFWLYDFSMFTSWAIFDRWEVTCVSNGTGHTLSRVYGLLSNSVDAFQSIYSFLADTSLNPTVRADLTLLSDFVDGLDASRRDGIIKAISHNTDPDEGLKWLQRLRQLKNCADNYYRHGHRLKPASTPLIGSCFGKIFSWDDIGDAYHLWIQETFSQFLKRDVHLNNLVILNRYVEHWARCIVDLEEGGQWKISPDQWMDIRFPIQTAHRVGWDPDIATYLVEMFSHLLKTDQLSVGLAFGYLGLAYPGFVECHRQHDLNPSPLTLFKDIQEWISRMPESDLPSKVKNAERVLRYFVCEEDLFIEPPGSRISDSEKQHLRSFAQFFVDFFSRGDVLPQDEYTTSSFLVALRSYLDQNPPIPS